MAVTDPDGRQGRLVIRPDAVRNETAPEGGNGGGRASQAAGSVSTSKARIKDGSSSSASEKVMAGTLVAAGVLVADDATVVGVADDAAIPVVVGVGAAVAGVTWVLEQVFSEDATEDADREGELIIGDKVREQMKARGWTEEMIKEALETEGIPAKGKLGDATRYVHPESGASVVVDNKTGEIFHVGKPGWLYE